MSRGFWFYFIAACSCGAVIFLLATAAKRAATTKQLAVAERVAAAERVATAERVAAAERAAAAERENIAAAPPAVAPDAGAEPQTEPEKPPERAKVGCAEYQAKVAQSSGPDGFDAKLRSGSWGSVPKPLRKLPSQAKLCGADSRGQVVITSPLFGAEFEAFYSPELVKLGFKPLTCKVVAGRTQCRSKRKRDLVVVVTDLSTQAFVLAFVHR